MKGAVLSAIFTIMSAHAGMEGVMEDDFTAQVHDVITLCGAAMAVASGLIASCAVLYRLASGTVHSLAAFRITRPRTSRRTHTTRLVRIFMP